MRIQSRLGRRFFIGGLVILLVLSFAMMAFATAEPKDTAPTDPASTAEQLTPAPEEEGEESESRFHATVFALLPSLIAIVLALITKEVYSSLFIGILSGALLYANFNPLAAYETLLYDGFTGVLSDSGNVGILIFLVVLGTLVALMNKAGGSRAYGEMAAKRIKGKKGALLSTFGLGCLIFVDDYFNCLTVGSVMKPLCDKFGITRAKLAYIIDATAAPICMIAPISSWAAAVSGYVDSTEFSGIELFIRAIPYNFYSLLTIVMIIVIALLGFDFGPMKRQSPAVEEASVADTASDDGKKKGHVMDLILPILVLITFCVGGMIYNGYTAGEATNLIDAFANTDASAALSFGSLLTLPVVMIYYLIRRRLGFKEMMNAIAEGFRAMVPAILILSFAWTLCEITSMLGADIFVEGLVKDSAGALKSMLPALLFLVAIGLSFSTGTSWGTFGILIPIVIGAGFTGELMIIAISACLAGSVCGDHCSPISDTTIMASAGAECDHITHVSTQLPYALTVAAVSLVSYIIAGFVRNVFIVLPVAILLMVATLLLIRKWEQRKAA